ncbi:hypothetical protein B0H11DRAFT_2228076 [Mycena galericulata]|nr:hypothetical protein B0H11DRAFT_2228076 [Mycena galericulata]
MSHGHHARAAHIRHANRAGGFGGLTDLFPPITFPGFGLPGPTTTTAKAPVLPTTKTTKAISVPPVLPTTKSVLSSAVPSPANATKASYYYDVFVDHDHFEPRPPVTPVAAALSSSSAVPHTSSALVAPVLGGVVGGIVGLAALIFLVTFFIRRRRHQDEDAVNFDPGAFRRSAIPITDPPTHQDTVARGYNPPTPPAMIQRHHMYPNPNYTNSPTADRSPTSGSQLIFQAPFSPIAANATSPVSAYAHNWQTTPPTPVLTRNISATSATSSVPSPHESAQYAQYPALPNTLAVPNEYLDLERTSVTPFQAAQYAEISQRLNTEVPKGLDTPAVNEFVVAKMPVKDTDLPPIPPKDPFTDDAAASHEGEDDDDDDDPSEDIHATVQDMSFPVPPSPVHSTASRYRVESMPPTLPEIIVQSRVSVNSTYLSEAGSPYMSGFPGGQTVVMKGAASSDNSPMGSRFPVTPSPLASSFTVPSPPAMQSTFPASPPPAQQRPDPKQRQSVMTVYDPEDAYGGI